MINIVGNTLYLKHESGNLGHYFNDHVYAGFSYYLLNKEKINNICIEFTDIFNIDKYIDNFNRKVLLSDKKKTDLSFKNFNMLILFFYDCNKNIYFENKKEPIYSFENLIKLEKDRFFEKNKNYLDVFNTLRSNFEAYNKYNNIKNERKDVTVLYRTESIDRNIYNIDILEDLFISNNLNYKLFNLSNFYNFYEIVDIFHNSDNIVSFWGCELTYGICMVENTQIIELTPNGHIEDWWFIMEPYYKKYGLNYQRFSVNTIENNLYLTDLICRNIFNLLKIKHLTI